MPIPRIFHSFLFVGLTALVALSSCATRIGSPALAESLASEPSSPEAPIRWPTEVLDTESSAAPDAGPRDAAESPHHHHHNHGAPHAK